MWGSLVLGVVVCCALLYIPGYFVIRSIGVGRLVSLVCAPVVSVAGFCFAAIAEELAGIACSWWSLFLPILAVSLLLFAIRAIVERKSDPLSAITFVGPVFSSEEKRAATWTLLCVLLSVFVATYVFLDTLDAPYSVYLENDVIAHLRSVNEAISTGVYYSLDGFYPCAWYTVVAMLMDLAQLKMGIAINAVNFVLAAVAFPSSMYLVLRYFFSGNEAISRWAILFPVAFTAFPWGFMLFGPLYPNLAGYSMLPMAMMFFILVFRSGTPRITRILLFALFVVSVLCLALLHPIAVFVGVVLLAPYCVHLIWAYCRESHTKKVFGRIPAKLFYSSLFVVFVLAVWTVLYLSPAFKGVVSFVWPAYLPSEHAIGSVLSLDYTKASLPQYPLAALVLIGIVSCMLNRKYVYLVVCYAISAVMLFFDMSTDGFLKHYLTGFWYTDEFRVACMVAMAGMPLAAIGIDAVFRRVADLLGRVKARAAGGKVLAFLVAALFLLLNYAPSYYNGDGVPVALAFGHVKDMLASGNSLEENVGYYDKAEYDFVEKVKQVVPDGTCIVNIPYDGSAFAVGLNDIDLLFSGWYGYDSQPSDSSAAIVRNHLSEVSSSSMVQQAVSDFGAEYLLLLDYQNENGSGMYSGGYDASDWQGVLSVTDETPGFEVVLSEGDMRLYRITALD